MFKMKGAGLPLRDESSSSSSGGSGEENPPATPHPHSERKRKERHESLTELLTSVDNSPPHFHPPIADGPIADPGRNTQRQVESDRDYERTARRKKMRRFRTTSIQEDEPQSDFRKLINEQTHLPVKCGPTTGDPLISPRPHAPLESRDLPDFQSNSHIFPPSPSTLSQQLFNLKKQLKLLESEYENLLGSPPTKKDKLGNKQMRKLVVQMEKLKKEMREGSASGAPPGGEKSRDIETLKLTVTSIEHKLKASCRPPELEKMTQKELQEEKLQMQRELVTLEKLHGRAQSREEKSVVKELYERYRKVKKMISPGEKLDLCTIHEGEELRAAAGSSSGQPMGVTEKYQPIRLEEGIGVGVEISSLRAKLTLAKEEKRRLRSTLRTLEAEYSQGKSSPVADSTYAKYKHVRGTVKLLSVLIGKRAGE